MSVRTYIDFLNGNDPEFIKAKNGTQDDRDEWEEGYGNMEDRPGQLIESENNTVKETNDEYGGWLIKVSDIPKDATHILIYRG